MALYDIDWSTIPTPTDDGAAAHLTGQRLPELTLGATDGRQVDLSRLPGRSVVYIYPRTGQPGQPMPDGWDMIPGARGCTPQSCAFRDHFAELADLGVADLFGLSTQTTQYQAEAVTRLHLPFALLSDADGRFGKALSLPGFESDNEWLLKRLTSIIDAGVITKVFYPVFPPDQDARDVIVWLRTSLELSADIDKDGIDP